ncbi:MAG: hypothetical protein IKR25_07325 [Muribaculaceae bacterium]|nr:hypothetical protein [Muribaculaceae bacterium]
MHWTCDKCGKTLEVSAKQLADTEGVVVCPQCLGTDVVPGYKRRRKSVPDRAASHDGSGDVRDTAIPASTPPPRRQRQSPPPHRKNQNLVNQPAHQNSGASQAPSPAKPRKKSSKKRSKRSSSGCLSPHSSLGCFWRSVVITLVMLALYCALGYLLQCS